MDAEGEWLVGNGNLYLIPPGGNNPGSLDLRAKQRDYAIVGRRLQFVEISGLRFFGCSFQLIDCEDCLVEYCNFLYPSYARGVPNAEEKGEKRPCPGTTISGSRNTIRSCSFEHCPNYGVVLQGEQNVIENSIVHDVNWAGTLHYSAVALRGGKGIERPRNVARHNTLYNVGNAIVTCSGPDSIVEYNHVHHGGLISADVALIYTSMPRADGVEFRYNWVHDSLSPDHSLGIRGDDKTRGLRVHHNVLWNVAKDGIVTKGGRNRVYNNTCLVNGASDIGDGLVPHTEMGSFNSHLRVQQKSGSGANIGQRQSMLTATGDRWIRRDLILEVPKDATPSILSLQLHQATGTVLLDDVSLIRCKQ